MDIEIRELQPGDRDGLEAALRSDETFRPDEVSVALELVDDALASEESDYWIRVAMLGQQIVGYVCFGPTPMTRATYDLYWVVTHAGHRGKGVASRLVRAMEEELGERGATAIRVETSQSEGYGAARRLYDRLGYPVAARFEDFYRPGDDLIVYYKRL